MNFVVKHCLAILLFVVFSNVCSLETACEVDQGTCGNGGMNVCVNAAESHGNDGKLFDCLEFRILGEERKVLGYLNSEVLVVFENQAPHHKIIEIIDLTEIIGVHPLSSRIEERDNIRKLSDDSGFVYGAFVAIVNVESQTIMKYYFQVETKEEEERLVIAIQQVSFFGDISPDAQLIDSTKRNLLVVINPKAGTQKGIKIFKKYVQPVFDLSHFSYALGITERSGHAIEIGKTFHPEEFTEIVSIGGDGTLHELIQGLFDHPKIPYSEIPKIPFSVIPAGTGNGLSWQTGSKNSPLIAALIASRGRSISFDVMTIVTPSSHHISFLFFAYGAFPDVDFGYHAFDFLGDLRYVIGGLHSCFMRSLYDMEVYYVQYEDQITSPSDPFSYPTKFSNFYEDHNNGIQFLKENEKKVYPGIPLLNKHFKKELDDMISNHKFSVLFDDDTSTKILRKTVVKNLTDPTFYFIVTNTRKTANDFWSSGNIIAGNGFMDLLYMRTENLSSMYSALKIFYQLMTNQNHMNDKNLWVSERIKAFYFIPKGENTSPLDIDGEEMITEPILGEVHQGLISLMYREKNWD